jgi:uncharacterized membrane protein
MSAGLVLCCCTSLRIYYFFANLLLLLKGVPGAGRSAGLSLHVLYTTYTAAPACLSLYIYTTSLRIYYCCRRSTWSWPQRGPLSAYIIHYLYTTSLNKCIQKRRPASLSLYIYTHYFFANLLLLQK